MRPKNDQELEVQARIRRTEIRVPTRADIRKMELKLLGRTWGKPRKKMTGWPK